jgi:hypothetical protein
VWQAKEELGGGLTFLLFDGTSDVDTEQKFAGNWLVDVAVDTSSTDYDGFPEGSFPAAVCAILRGFAPRYKDATKADIRKKVTNFIWHLRPDVCKFGEEKNQDWNMPLLDARCWLVRTTKGNFGRRVVTPDDIGVDVSELVPVPQLICKAEVDGAVASNNAAAAIDSTGSSSAVYAAADVAGGNLNDAVLLQQLEQLQKKWKQAAAAEQKKQENITLHGTGSGSFVVKWPNDLGGSPDLAWQLEVTNNLSNTSLGISRGATGGEYKVVHAFIVPMRLYTVKLTIGGQSIARKITYRVAVAAVAVSRTTEANALVEQLETEEKQNHVRPKKRKR